MSLPYVERKIETTPVPPPSAMRNLDDAIAVYRALVERDNYPTLQRFANENFVIGLHLADQCLVSQLVELEAIAKGAHPNVQCLVEGQDLIIR